MASSFVGRFGALIGGGIVVLTAAMPTLQAQTPAAYRSVPAPIDRSQDSITLTGCLLLGPYGEYTLSHTIAAAGTVMNAVAWKLEARPELLGHVLETVEITGTMMRKSPDARRPPGGAGTDRPADLDGAVSYHLRVKTIKRLVGDCS